MEQNLKNNQKVLKLELCRQRRKVWNISSVFIFLSLLGLVLSLLNPSIGFPLRPGLDFTGGTQITLDRECKYKCESINTENINQYLSQLSLPSPTANKPNISVVSCASIISRCGLFSGKLVEGGSIPLSIKSKAD